MTSLIGQVVRQRSGPLLKVVSIYKGVACCLHINHRGQVERRFLFANDLTPLWRSFMPRSIWPETNDGGEDEPPPKKRSGRSLRSERRQAERKKATPKKPSHEAKRRARMSVDRVLREISVWRSEKLWTAKIIAHEAGCSEETIANWARLPDCPIKLVGGRYFVLRGDLVRWMSKESAKDTAASG